MVRTFLKEATDVGWIDGYKERYVGEPANTLLVEQSLAFRAAIQRIVDKGELEMLEAELREGNDASEADEVSAFTHELMWHVLSGGVMEMKTVDLILMAPKAVLQDALLHMIYCKTPDAGDDTTCRAAR